MWGQDAEQSKAARCRAYTALADVSIFQCLFPCKSMEIILAFFQKTSACRGSSKGRQRKTSKMIPGSTRGSSPKIR